MLAKHNPSPYLLPGLLLLQAGLCQAGSIELSPVRINLSASAKVAVLTVRNIGAESSVMQVSLNRWKPEGIRYTYEPSQDLVITPTTFRLLPGRQQIVRIGTRSNLQVSREAAYRLFVEEVPPPPSPNNTETRLVIRHDLPVFVAPAESARPKLVAALECASNGTSLRMGNIGNAHVQLRHIALKALPGPHVLGSWDAFDYLLPDAQKSWDLAKAAPAALGKAFVVVVQTELNSYTVEVRNNCPMGVLRRSRMVAAPARLASVL
ncbi:fimbria/pilus periplasmic chaperone [Chitinimonas viridis]|uniref:Fimbria/pilus periplasmic chaperone n=1 Tax=Chitinimonas viridis TaxID=664880 RepID=A0ABT8AZ05_9NEIS|nr:fimbria/pilus periplasmic chaperone [Chitinimonas viridis]MDN3575229.1 fimbria/pilus periplasmic chaperone [Chitinimonas viridis]